MTGDPQETFVNPTEALTAAGRLNAAASDFADRWSELKGRIDGLHADAPWGTDEVGQEFASKYLPSGEEGAGAVVAGLTTLEQTLSEVGPSVAEAVTGTVQTDEETGRSMQV